MAALIPALWLALFTFRSGTLAGGAEFAGAVSAHAALLGFCTLAGSAWRDPLGLGDRAKWLVPAALALVIAAWWASPVHRAGILPLLLLPGFLLAAPAVGTCWRSPDGRQRGVEALCLLLGLVAVWALLQWHLQGSPRAAMPLGHHNLLAGWLITIWPLALLALRWRGAWRVIGALVGAVGVVALAGCSSFLAGWAFLVQALAAGVCWRRARVWLALALLVVYFGPSLDLRPRPLDQTPAPAPSSQLQRAQAIAAGQDSSASARAVYARAGWRGITERPLLGWGPGAVPWTIAPFLQPVPGLNPPSEIVGDLHSLPLQIAYELGLTGVIVGTAIVVLFVWRRARELRRAGDRAVPLAACIGLLGSGVFALGNAPVAVLALPAALAVVVGASLSTTATGQVASLKVASPIALAYVLPVALVLLPFERAHFHYQQAVAAAGPASALDQIERAAELDPDFPLYRARAAWLADRVEGTSPATARDAHRAAKQAYAVAPLWLAAGALAIEAGEPWAAEALQKARELDPLSPLPVFHLLRARPGGRDAEELGRLALAAEPRLKAALFWEQHPALWTRVTRQTADGSVLADTSGPTVELTLSMDGRTAVSFSLFAFRRSPWPADLAPVRLRLSRLP